MKIKNRIRELRNIRAADLKPNPKNWRTHPKAQQDALKGILSEVGYADALIARELEDGSLMLVDGHLRAETTPDEKVPVLVLDVDEAEADKLLLSLDPLAALAETNSVALDGLLHEIETGSEALQEMYADLADAADLYQTDEQDSDAADETQPSVKLSDKFGVAPFSVLNARDGWWQERKRQWVGLGIESEVGRKGNLLGMSETVLEPDAKTRELKKVMAEDSTNMHSLHMVPGYYDKKKSGMSDEQIAEEYLQSGNKAGGTSIFDPVLAELAYQWFSPSDGIVLDPFAGGSVRGIVAGKLGRTYVGCELRQEQVEANRKQAEQIKPDVQPTWHCTDSRKIDSVCKSVKADFVFSCPPYADLEVYSDDKDDLSNMPYDQFVEAYSEIISKACSLLKNNSFACFVVGDVRDKKGNYLNFVGDTIAAFMNAGLHYYNEAILVTPVGTLPIRAGKVFSAGRKLGKTHQNVLVFAKGDGKKAAKRCGSCEFGAIDEAEKFGEVLE